MRIVLGTISIVFLVFYACVPRFFRNHYPVCPYLWVEEKFFKFRQSTQNVGNCTADLPGHISSDPAFNLSEKNAIYPSLILGRVVFRDWLLLDCFSQVSLATTANFFLFLNVAVF